MLAIASGKGGVGKSSVTTNLAVALAQRGHKVAAVDADVWGFSMPRMLGIDRPPTVIDDVIVPPDANGVTLISMGFFAREDQPVVWRGPMLHKALEQFLTDVHWGEPDYLVVDMPPGTGDIALSMAQFLPRAEVVIVTTPQPAAQKVAQRAAYMARKVNLQVIGVIENMSWFQCDHGTTYRLFGEGGGAGAGRRSSTCRCSARCRSCPSCAPAATTATRSSCRDPDDEASQSCSARSPSASTSSSRPSASTAPSSRSSDRPAGRVAGHGSTHRSRLHRRASSSSRRDDDADDGDAAPSRARSAGDDALLWLTDTKGRRVGVPTDKIAYVEIAGDAGDRKVGFGVR